MKTKSDVINEQSNLKNLLDKISSEIDMCCNLPEVDDYYTTTVFNMLRTLRSECISIIWALEANRKSMISNREIELYHKDKE